MRRIWGLPLAGFVAALFVAPAASAEPADLVLTDRGPVYGVVREDHRVFLGIPFAAPPVGELRWRAAPRWSEPLDATAPRGACAQPGRGGNPEVINEDCLYLNVTTPTHASGRLPVMVWIHGGEFLIGNGAGFNARKLAVEGDVVVVTVNYRLVAFGFLAHPASALPDRHLRT